jgi:hypothetical protein
MKRKLKILGRILFQPQRVCRRRHCRQFLLQRRFDGRRQRRRNGRRGGVDFVERKHESVERQKFLVLHPARSQGGWLGAATLGATTLHRTTLRAVTTVYFDKCRCADCFSEKGRMLLSFYGRNLQSLS